jgi:2-keto-3-deoxy-L-rhamnonate aldolase RhmA
MGYPAMIDQPEVQEAILKIVEKTKKAGLLSGIFVRNVEEAKHWADKGVQFIAFGGDKGFLFSACRSTLSQLEDINN